jgi:hypothetical protein
LVIGDFKPDLLLDYFGKVQYIAFISPLAAEYIPCYVLHSRTDADSVQAKVVILAM